MSWSVSCSGSLAIVKKSVKSQFASQKDLYVGTEEGRLMELARKLVIRVLKTHPKHRDVVVSCSGHSGGTYDAESGTYVNKDQTVAISVFPK